MTDHRPEVRRALAEAIEWLSIMRSRNAIRDDHTKWTDSSIERWKAALAAPPIEPVGMQEALEQVMTAWNCEYANGRHTGITHADGFANWFSANIELIQAALRQGEDSKGDQLC